VVSVDQLHDRMNVVADQATAAHAAVAGMETLAETVTSDGRRIEALELHTRRTDARLGDVVDAKLAELVGPRSAELEAVRAQLLEALDAHRAETRAQVIAALHAAQAELATAMDAARAELATARDAGRTELAERAAAMAERQATLDRQAAQAVAGLDDLASSVGVALREAEDRLAERVQEQLAAVDAGVGELAEARSEIAASTASLTRKVARLQDQVHKKVAEVVAQVDGLAVSASKEAGALAPLRSDLRLLQAQVAELTEAVAELRPRRKPPAGPTKGAAARKAASPVVKGAGRRSVQ
jgi:chromosome segregation ATPase